jgi:hypothetical protein
LSCHQQTLPPIVGRIHAGGPLFEHFDRIDPRHAQRRQQARQQARGHRDGDSKHPRPPIEVATGTGQKGEVRRCRVQDQSEQPLRDHETSGTAGCGEQGAFDEHAPHQRCNAGAERGHEGQFPGAARRAHQQQVHDVDARDQQHEPDCAEQRVECPSGLAPKPLLKQQIG